MWTYFWVAVGGAIGSVARLWLSVHVALLTGLGFPWGTILVNILGSLVIGFVATLTGPNGRVVVPTDLPGTSPKLELCRTYCLAAAACPLMLGAASNELYRTLVLAVR